MNRLNFLTKFLFSENKNLMKTRLHDLHEKLGARMVEFAGYHMPVQYKDGVLKEHLQVREKAGIFDVSHMGQIKIYGDQRVDFLEKLVVGDIRNQQFGKAFLSLILNEQAGIIDDTIVTKFEDHIHMVVNGANKFIDLKHLDYVKEKFFSNAEIKIDYLENRQLLAIQGPKAAESLQELVSNDLSKIPFLTHMKMNIKKLDDLEVWVCRCGYTGEDGFEISVPEEKTVEVFDLLLQNQNVFPIGLGARDSLRTEAGLCLHGNDMDDKINPSEATLMWLVRKQKVEENLQKEKLKFLGREKLSQAIKDGIKKKRIGFKVLGSGILRPILDVKDDQGEKVGHVCTGTYSPILKIGIGMAYVQTELAKPGTKLKVIQRNKEHQIELCKTPFVPSRYFKI